MVENPKQNKIKPKISKVGIYSVLEDKSRKLRDLVSCKAHLRFRETVVQEFLKD